MHPISFKNLFILLITALIFMQGVSALTIEQAPLNPAFVAYTEGLDSDDIDQYFIECCGDSCLTQNPAPHATGLLPSPAVVVWPDGYAAEPVDEDFPTRFDLRDERRVTPARDQGKCGSCWAFATYGSLESTYLTDTGQAEDFSEKNMNNLCSNLYEDGFDSAPCKGGFAFMSTAYLARGSGPVLEEDDPYILPKPSTISPTNLSPVLDVRDVTYLPPRAGPLDNNLFRQTLRNEGAIWVAFTVNWSCFADNYTTYYWPGEEYASNGGHAVTLVGWDDTFPKDAFAVEAPDDGAFILKNSWGTSSGEDGYFYISYYDPSLGYFQDEETPSYDLQYDNTPGALYTGVPADPNKRIYQYDSLGWTESIGTGEDTTYYGANVFTAETYEELTDVSFYTREPETEYTVAIFTDFITPPGDAAPVAWKSGTTDLPGYHTISLPETVPLMPGEVFSVVLEVSSPTDTHPLVVEMPIDGYSSGAIACPGESFVSEDGDTWEDLTISSPNTNVCIKAFTSPITVVPGDYATIQEAVNAATSGDTIIVKAGTYTEELVLNKTITLIGEGMPVLATTEYGTGMEIEADNVTLTGFSFDGSGDETIGIIIEGDDCTIRDTDVHGYICGLCTGNVRGTTLSTIALQDNTFNLHFGYMEEKPGNHIDETVTVNGRPVIYREGVSGETIGASSNAGMVICVNCTDITIHDITFRNVAQGVVLDFCRDITVDTITADMVYSGVDISHSENVTVQHSSFGPEQIGEGIFADYSTGLQVVENEILPNANGSGMFLFWVDTATISNNTIGNDTHRTSAGALFYETANITIADNTMCTTRMGLRGLEILECIVTGNTIDGSPAYAIEMLDAHNMTLAENTMEATGCGISVGGNVVNVTVSDNTMHCNDTGFGMLIAGDEIDITGNIAENCLVQAWMTLNNSVVRDNHFSGTEYPNISNWGYSWSGDVYVYRNDFVRTDGDSPADALVTATTSRYDRHQLGWSLTDDVFPDTPYADVILSDRFRDERFISMAETADMPPERTGLCMDSGMDESVYRSPSAETYWYHGQGFTGFMGNYWSTYNGTDSAHDGIGDTPFTIRENETDTFPLVKPGAWYADVNPDSGSDDPSADMATASALSAGDSATLSFTGSAVQTVTVTAADGTGRIVLTIDQARSGPDGLTGTVYQYISAQLTGMTDDEIKEADFSFRVPAAWMKAEGVLPTGITLWRFHDSAWQELPTSLVREDGGWVHYTAKTPGFSTFAIAEGDGQKMAITTKPIVSVENTETETAEENISVILEPPVTVAIPEGEPTANPTEEATTPQESPLGFITVIGGATGAALLFRRR